MTLCGERVAYESYTSHTNQKHPDVVAVVLALWVAPAFVSSESDVFSCLEFCPKGSGTIEDIAAKQEGSTS